MGRYDRELAAGIDEISEAQLANRWREQEQGWRELYVAELAGRPVGTVSLRADPDGSMHLFALEVADEVRSRGIGTRLVEFVVAEARRRGCIRVYLEVRTDNPARRLYHRLGFRRVETATVQLVHQVQHLDRRPGGIVSGRRQCAHDPIDEIVSSVVHAYR